MDLVEWLPALLLRLLGCWLVPEVVMAPLEEGRFLGGGTCAVIGVVVAVGDDFDFVTFIEDSHLVFEWNVAMHRNTFVAHSCDVRLFNDLCN